MRISGEKQIYFYSVVILLLVAAAGCDTSNTVINPEIVSVDASTVTIAWMSQKPYRGQISYYAAGDRRTTKTAEENFSHSYRHEVTIDGLETGTKYYYWMGDDETKYFFRTKPAAVKPFSFLIELDNLSDQISALLMSEMPEFILSFSKESENNYYRSIKPYVPLYDSHGQNSDQLNADEKLASVVDAWKLDWGGLSLIFIEDASELNRFLDSPTAHTTGIIMRDSRHGYDQQAVKSSALHHRIIDHNQKFPSNKIAFVFVPGSEIAINKVDTINYLQLPLVAGDRSKSSAAIRIDVNIEATYAVLLDTGDEIPLRLPPLGENRTCEECRRLASAGSYKESVLAYQEFIENNQGHYQIDDAYYAIADILDTKLFQYQSAAQWYGKLISGYPASTLTPLASQRLAYLTKYADYNFIPLSRFEKIRRVEFLQSNHDLPARDKILAKTAGIIEQYPDAVIAPVIYYWLANQYRGHNVQKAQEMYLTLLNKYPDHPHSKEVWWEIGEAYYEAKNYEKAITVLKEALMTIPASSEDIKAQIARAKRNLRRRHLQRLCVVIPVGIILLSVLLPPVGMQSKPFSETVLAFGMLLILFSSAGWLISEQFSSIAELLQIAAGMAAAFTCGFPFSYRLSNKLLKSSNRRSDKKPIYTTLCGITINLIFAAAIVFLTIFHTNEHFLTIVKL